MFFVILITVSFALIQTSTNTCTTEKSVFKLDIRKRVSDLPASSTIQDIDGYALCQEAYSYDYIWLYQLWTPSEYNYKLNSDGTAKQTNDYRELQSIKEYSIDPTLGSLTELLNLQSSIREFCPHMKFLGEFSFYVSTDSTLTSNITRFLRRLPTDNYNIYNERYDDDDFVWAVNDQMKTIPFTAQWNYFDPTVIADMKDIMYRVIISQHELDGIVFLQPSLGLYNIIVQSFKTEIQYFGKQSYLQDFYINIGLKLKSQDLFYLGGEDKSNSKIILQNYLLQIYGNPNSKVWPKLNYTFSNPDPYITIINPKYIIADKSTQLGGAQNQGLPNAPTCIQYQINAVDGLISAGVQTSFGLVLCNDGNFRYDGDSLLDGTQCSNYSRYDFIELQYFADSGQIIFMKSSSAQTMQQQQSVQIPDSYANVAFTIKLQASTQIEIGIRFPFFYSQILKNDLVTPNRLLISTSITYAYINQNYFYFNNILPNINQNEDSVTLNFYIAVLDSNQTLGVGVCNQDAMNIKYKVPLNTSLGNETYILKSDGYALHNSSSTYLNQKISDSYAQGDTISVMFTKSNSSIQFYKDSQFLATMPLIDRVKNLNFCVALNIPGQRINLVY